MITVDDVLEATIPDDWRRREPPAASGAAARHEAELADASTPDRSKPDQLAPEPKG